MIRLNFKEFLKDSSGGTAVAMGLCLVTLAIVLGAGLDTTRLVSAKQKTVDALDAATLYAVNQSAEGDFNERAQTYFANQLTENPFSIENSNFEMVDGAMVGTATTNLPLIFGAFLGRDNRDIAVKSVVALPESSGAPCIMALSTSRSQAALLNSGATIESEACEIHIHSERRPSVILNSGVVLDVARTCVAGVDIIDNSGQPNPVETGCDVAPNPFAGQFPEPDTSECDFNGENYNSATISLTPGVYCGRYNFNNSSAIVDFAPGTYILKNGGWNVNGGDWYGEGVTFYYADRSNIQFNSGVKAEMTAPSSGPYAGMFMLEKEGIKRSQFIVNDSRGFNFQGSIYLPSRDFHLNSGANITVRRASIIVDTISINGAFLRVEPPEGLPGATQTAGAYFTQ